MKEIKRASLRVVLAAEILLVTFFYLCGTGGLQALKHADVLNITLFDEIKKLESEVTGLSQELGERTSNPFYKESIARKELQMAYPDEIIYMLPKG